MFERKEYDEFPTIIIEEGNITLKGRSIPEDADIAYYPFIKRLELLALEQNPLTVNFILDYYNTASTRYITRIISILEDMAKVTDVIINWYYLPMDEDMFDLGEDYKELSTKIKFNIVKR